VVLRRQQADSYVAQDTHSAAAPAATSPEEKHYVDHYGDSTNAPSPGRTNDSLEKTKQAPAVAPPPNTPPTVTSVDADVAKEDKAVPQAKVEEQKVATDAPPPAKPEPTPTPEPSPRAAEPGAARNEVKVQPAASAAAKDEKELRGAQRDDDRQTGNFTRRPVAGIQSSSTDRSGAADLSANTRVVAGRRFRKQGGVWIDTAYDSSKDVMTLTRGSEQYRALVADEPAIKTIADQLEGEIIVVWKTRTYRIH
jgi:outer membrane biosynthesis protein TonB